MFDRKIKKLSGGGEGKAEANHLTNAFGWIKVAGGVCSRHRRPLVDKQRKKEVIHLVV